MQTIRLPNPSAILRRITALSATRTRARDSIGPGWSRVAAEWIERRRQRRALARLDARLLDDVGITPEEAARESARPFWR